LLFAEVQLAIFNSCPSHRAWVAAMFQGLRREIDAALMLSPANCEAPR
jgi:hypothetical protein